MVGESRGEFNNYLMSFKIKFENVLSPKPYMYGKNWQQPEFNTIEIIKNNERNCYFIVLSIETKVEEKAVVLLKHFSKLEIEPENINWRALELNCVSIGWETELLKTQFLKYLKSFIDGHTT